MPKLFFLLIQRIEGISFQKLSGFGLNIPLDKGITADFIRESNKQKITVRDFLNNQMLFENYGYRPKPVTVSTDFVVDGSVSTKPIIENDGMRAPSVYETGAIQCRVKYERDVSQKIYDFFSNRDPENSEDHQSRSEGFLSKRRRSGSTFRKSKLVEIPEHVAAFSEQVYKELSEEGLKLVGLLRWRFGCTSPHNALQEAKLCYSLDGEIWSIVPRPTDFFITTVRDLDLNERDENEIINALHEHFNDSDLTLYQDEEVPAHIYKKYWDAVGPAVIQFYNMAKAGEEEPLAHVLFREAWTERIASPRSALLIGVSSLEIGVKHYIRRLVPDAEWLVENLPSPPVERILREYLPLIPAKCSIKGKVVPPPENLMKTVKKAVFMRNKLTHAGPQKIEPDTLDEILQTIEDILWLLDYYSGQEWAIFHMRDSVVQELHASVSSTP